MPRRSSRTPTRTPRSASWLSRGEPRSICSTRPRKERSSMATDLTRRNVLRSLGMGAVAGSVLRAIPLEAAEYAHGLIEAEKADAKSGEYTPKYFDPHGYKTLQSLCDTILPAD